MNTNPFENYHFQNSHVISKWQSRQPKRLTNFPHLGSTIIFFLKKTKNLSILKKKDHSKKKKKMWDGISRQERDTIKPFICGYHPYGCLAAAWFPKPNKTWKTRLSLYALLFWRQNKTRLFSRRTNTTSAKNYPNLEEKEKGKKNPEQ